MKQIETKNNLYKWSCGTWRKNNLINFREFLDQKRDQIEFSLVSLIIEWFNIQWFFYFPRENLRQMTEKFFLYFSGKYKRK